MRNGGYACTVGMNKRGSERKWVQQVWMFQGMRTARMAMHDYCAPFLIQYIEGISTLNAVSAHMELFKLFSLQDFLHCKECAP